MSAGGGAGLSLREFARRDGCDDKVVRRAVSAGGLKTLPDGTLDERLVGTGWRKRNRNVSAAADTSADNSADILLGDDEVVPPSVIAALNMTASPARAAHAVRAWGSVVELVGRLDRGGSVFAISASQFSALDVLFAVLARIGPARVDIWTYTPGQTEAEALGRLLGEKKITGLRLVLDQSGMHTRGIELYERIQDRFGLDAVRVSKAHAKLVALSTDDGWRIVIDGSANLAKNLRFEQVNIRDDTGVWGVVDGLTTELFAAAPPPDLAKFNGAAARATVKAIAGDKPWSPSVGPDADALGRPVRDLDTSGDDLGDDVIGQLLGGRHYDMAQAERIKANALALRQMVNARRDAGAVVEIELAERVLFEEARKTRDALLNFGAKAGPLIAADIGAEPDPVVEALNAHVHALLGELGEPSPDFAG